MTVKRAVKRTDKTPQNVDPNPYDWQDPLQGVIAGVDEAGRGPLAGPVFAAAVVLSPHHPIVGLQDSKKLTEKKRDFYFEQICEHALDWAIAEASVEEIDTLNILQASLLAMQRAVAQLQRVSIQSVWVDGNQAPRVPYPVRTVVQGDQFVEPISAASILAKVARDRAMQALHEIYPEYDFLQHKGYPTRAHVEKLERYGVSPVHRKSFRPVRMMVGSFL